MSHQLHTKQKDKISTEMYLKTIYLLIDENKLDPRPVDLVNKLGLAKASVSEMLKKLNDENYIEYQSYGKIKLTKKGTQKAKNVLRKYIVVKEFLTDILKNNPKGIHDEACNLEHAFSDESIARLNILLKFMKKDVR